MSNGKMNQETMFFANHAAFFWKASVIVAIVVFVIIALWSLVMRKQGTFTSDYLLPLDSIISPKQRGRDSKQEAQVRACLEGIFVGYKFENQRPDWLINVDTGHRLELDCYNQELNLAVEVQGIQHVKPVIGWFHKTYDDFEKQQIRDAAKADLCGKRGVNLITIPFNVSHEKTCKFLTNELAKKKLLPTYLAGW